MSKYIPEKAKADRAWYKERGICYVCKKRPAFGRFTQCPECLERNTIRAAKWRMENPDRAKQLCRNTYYKRKAEGRCVDCGKPNPDAGSNCRCPDCALNNRMRQKRNKVHKVRPEGICRICDKPVFPGKKLCEEHWIIAKNRLLAVRPGNANHSWRKSEKARLTELWSDTRARGGNE